MATMDAFQLEAKRKDDSSWHPCHVSLCPSGVGLIVEYDNDSEDLILNKEEALARLRIRSVPLQGDDCSYINQGEHVLATLKSQSKTLFFDAEVEKALRVRHSKRIHCRCTFAIRWLHQEREGGTLIVPSHSIMKLATKSINIHPTISAFLNTVETSSCSTTFSLPSVDEDMDCEVDIHELLEKQIAEIGNSADASEKRISKDILFRVGVDTKGQIHCRGVVASRESESPSPIQVSHSQNHLKRSTRSRSKLQMEMEAKNPPLPTPSIPEEFSESKSPLNPLAARAALASLMSKLPQKLELSIDNEGKSLTYSADITTHKYVATESLNGDKSYTFSANNLSRMEFSPNKQAASVTFVPKPDSIVKSRFSTGSAEGKLRPVEVSSGAQIKETENENKALHTIDSSAVFTCSTAESNRRQSTKTARQTRSAVQKETGTRNDYIQRTTSFEETKLKFSTNSKRLTRSAVQREGGILTFEAKKVIEENTSARNAESDISDQNGLLQESYILKEKKMHVSPLNTEINLLPSEERKSPTKKEVRNKKHDIERKTSVEERGNLNKTRRMTRSAVHEEIGNKSMEKGLKESKYSEDMKSDFSEGTVTPGSNILETHKLISSPLEDESYSQEMNKKRKMSNAVNITKKTEDIVAGGGENNRDLKRKSTNLKKQELRSSPRLRVLSQTKS